MKSDTPVYVDFRAVKVGYFSNKISHGRRYDCSGQVAIGIRRWPSSCRWIANRCTRTSRASIWLATLSSATVRKLREVIDVKCN